MTRAVLLVVSLAVVACSGPGPLPPEGGGDAGGLTDGGLDASDDGGVDTSPVATPDWFRPDPLNVQPTFGTSSATSTDLGPDGGSLALTDVRGTQFTLTVEAGTLDTTSRFTLTPLAAVAGAPFSGGILGGVRLEPEGAVFPGGATLTIVPPAAPAAGLARIGFGFLGQGTGFYLDPLEDNPAGSGPLDLTLTTWSGGTWGIVDLGPQDAAMQATSHIPSRLLDAFAQFVASSLAQGANRPVRGRPEDLTDAEALPMAQAPYLGTLYSGFDKGIRDALIDAATKRASIAEADARFKEWVDALRQGRWSGGFLIGHPAIKPLVAEGWRLLAKAYGDSVQRALTSCLSERKPGQAFVARTWIAKGQRQLQGTTLPAAVLKDFNTRVTGFQADLGRCFTFTLDFDSDLSDSGFKGGTLHVVVHAGGQLGLDAAQIPLVPGVFTIGPDTKCTQFSGFTHTASAPGRYKLQGFVIADDEDLAEERANNLSGFELAYDPGKTVAGYTVTDSCNHTTNTFTQQPLWLGNFVILHQGELDPLQGWVVKTWDAPPGFGDGFASKTYAEQHDFSNGALTGTTKIKIRHTPVAAPGP